MPVRLPIETARLVVRPLVPEDAEAMHELFSDREAMRLLAEPADDVEKSREWVQAKIDKQEREGISMWAVVERATGEVVGDAGLQYEEFEWGREIDLGCRLVRRHWAKGYATEACEAILRAGFSDLGAGRIVATTEVTNVAARRVLEKLGMVYERDIRAWGKDMALYALSARGTLPAGGTSSPC